MARDGLLGESRPSGFPCECRRLHYFLFARHPPIIGGKRQNGTPNVPQRDALWEIQDLADPKDESIRPTVGVAGTRSPEQLSGV